MRKRRIGTIVSDKPDKTVVVRVNHYVKHPVYKKYIKRNTKVYAHDAKNEYKNGDKVMIEETRPLSKLKHWRVLRRVK